MEAMDVHIEPVLTEKTNVMREGETREYVFKVDPRANKGTDNGSSEGTF